MIVAEIGSASTIPQRPVNRVVNSGMLKPTHDSKQSPKRNKQHEQDEEHVLQDRKKSTKNKSQSIMNTHFDGYA